MHTRIRRAFFVVMLAMLGPCIAFAGELETVEVEGTGKTVQDAERDALRQAVVQVSGAMVDMETLIENDSLVKDQILSASAGVVEKMDRIGKPVGNLIDGYTVKIKATVRKGVLVEKLLSTNIASNKVEGADLFASSATAAEKNAAGAQMLTSALEGLPDNLLVARLLDQKIEKEGEITTVQFRIEYFMHQEAYYTKIMPKLREILDTVALRKTDRIAIDSGRRNNGIITHGNFGLNIPYDNEKEIVLALNIGRNQTGDNLRWVAYALPIERYRDLLLQIQRRVPYFRIACLDSNGIVINERQNLLDGRYNDNRYVYFPGFITDEYNSIFAISPFLRNANNFRGDFKSFDSFSFTWNIDFSLSEVRRIADVRFYFVPGFRQ